MMDRDFDGIGGDEPLPSEKLQIVIFHLRHTNIYINTGRMYRKPLCGHQTVSTMDGVMAPNSGVENREGVVPGTTG
jgi:hypothetical protein